MAIYYVANYGSNSNNGTTPATPWQTVQFALGAASGTNPGLVAGDTVWIAPGTYREVITSTALTGTAGNTIKIYGDPKFTQAWTAGSVGRVRLTNYTVDTANPTPSQTLAIIGDYIDIQDLCLDGLPVSLATLNIPEQSCFFIRGGNNTVTRCSIQTSSPNRQSGLQIHFLAGKKTCVISQCTFISGISIWITSAAQTNPFDLDATVRDCFIFSGNDYGIVMEGAAVGIVGLRAYNNTIINSQVAGIFLFGHSTTSSTQTVIRNNFIYSSRGQGIMSQNTSITITQSNNSIIASTTFGNISPATSNVNPCMLDFGSSRIQQFSTLPWFAPMSGSPLIGAGTATGAPTVDLYGNTWTSTPTIGAIESKVETPNPVYQPTERNASTITIAPSSTSQSIELYLGVTGLTASTSGLSAYYNRTRSADVQIPLVARNITQNWTSGGFAEVNANTMPGVYRLDIPNEALAAGADDVTVVVRGASGTNGAVMSIKLSSGGLTTAQTASAVWGALTNDHTTHGTFGWNVLRADQDSKEGLVTLHQSGGISRVDADVHAIANDTAAATALKGALNHDGTGYVDSDVVRISTSTAAANELEGALLHNGTDYIDSNLIGGNSTRVFVGRFQLTQTGTTQGDIIEAFTTDTPAFELQLFDGDNNIVPVTGATLGLRILDVTSTVVETGTPTIEYGTGGIVRWTAPGSYVSIGCPAGMYRLFVDRTVSGTTTTFGPLQIKVQVQ